MSRTDEGVSRFELVSDPAPVVENLRQLWRKLWAGWAKLPLADDQLWVHAVDRASGASVRVVPRGARMFWGDDLRSEAVARVVMRMGLPDVVPVLHAGPGVVYAEPPASDGWPRLAVSDAAACALAACEVAARLLAVGVTNELMIGPGNLRVLGGGRIAWLVPGVSTFAAVDDNAGGTCEKRVAAVFGALPESHDWQQDPVARVVWQLAGMFFELAGDEALVKDMRLAAVARVFLARNTGLDVAGLAGLLVELTAEPEAWRAWLAGLPVVRVPPRLALDWDLIIEDGEVLTATPPENVWSARHSAFVTIPLAEAYHQRACLAFNGGRIAEALGDATMAVKWDASVVHRTTRAVILDALGRMEEARAEIDAAFATPPLIEVEDWYGQALEPAEEARVYATRGTIALRERAYVQAEEDLRRAFAAEPTAARAHALGAVLYARGQVLAASQAEAISVSLAPDNPGYRWALVLSLVRLGRLAEARAHADELLKLAPGVYDERVAAISFAGR